MDDPKLAKKAWKWNRKMRNALMTWQVGDLTALLVEVQAEAKREGVREAIEILGNMADQKPDYAALAQEFLGERKVIPLTPGCTFISGQVFITLTELVALLERVAGEAVAKARAAQEQEDIERFYPERERDQAQLAEAQKEIERLGEIYRHNLSALAGQIRSVQQAEAQLAEARTLLRESAALHTEVCLSPQCTVVERIRAFLTSPQPQAEAPVLPLHDFSPVGSSGKCWNCGQPEFAHEPKPIEEP